MDGGERKQNRQKNRPRNSGNGGVMVVITEGVSSEKTVEKVESVEFVRLSNRESTGGEVGGL
jgi:hypothetical protein